MKLLKQQAIESGMIDYDALTSVIQEIKAAINPDNNHNVLLIDNLYFIIDYNNISDRKFPSRYRLLYSSDFVFRIIYNQIEILKSRIPLNCAIEKFENYGILVYQTTTPSHIDEE
jgi:hypothetical protein